MSPGPGATAPPPPPGHVVWSSHWGPESGDFLQNAAFPSGVVLGSLMEQPFPYQDLSVALPGALLLHMGFLMQQFLPFQNH